MSEDWKQQIAEELGALQAAYDSLDTLTADKQKRILELMMMMTERLEILLDDASRR